MFLLANTEHQRLLLILHIQGGGGWTMQAAGFATLLSPCSVVCLSSAVLTHHRHGDGYFFHSVTTVVAPSLRPHPPERPAASLLKALTEAGMTETERKMTPAPPDCKPHKKDCPDVTTKEGKEMKEEMDSKPYANRVGSLLWLARTYRFDISWVVGMLTRFMANPGHARL